MKTVLILGANSDVAKAALLLYVQRGFRVMAASRSTGQLDAFVRENKLPPGRVTVHYFDAEDYPSHTGFYAALPEKPAIVLYAAGFLVQNEEAFSDWEALHRMIAVHYAGAVSILNLIVKDPDNPGLERIVGMSSLSGVRGRKSNFIYGSTKAAFTRYLEGLRQHLFSRKVRVNAIVAGYIRTKINAGLKLNESLMLEPEFVARAIVNAGGRFTIVPGWKWKIIYRILRLLPERLAAKLP